MLSNVAKILMVGGLLCFGCAKKEPPPPTLTEAQQRFEDKCREDFDLYVQSRQVGNTLYIYLPTDKPIFDYEAQKEKGEKVKDVDKKLTFNINYLEGVFAQKNFSVEYDITDKKKSSDKDYGYSSSYSESYVKQQNNLFVALSSIYADTKPGANETPVLFFVIIIRDIKKGIEASSTIYMEDFKRYMAGDLPWEEFMKRFLPDTKGSTEFIGDETGSHINYVDIKLPDFLAKQMINRIQFKFQRSDFKPGIKFENDIVSEIANTLRYYHFKEFDYVKLNNLRDDKKFTFDQKDLAAFGEDTPVEKDQGKLIHIIFENGKIKAMDEAPVEGTSPAGSEKAVN